VGRSIDLDDPPEECKPYADLYEREHKEKVSLENQVRHVRDTWTAPTVYRETLRQLALMEQERNVFKARLEGLLSKPDPGHPTGNGKPWAHAEAGEVAFGLLEDGTDEESYDIETAESMASSLWRAAQEARRLLGPRGPVDPGAMMPCGCYEKRHPPVHWSVAPERWQAWANSLFEETGWTCRYGWPIPRPTDDYKKYQPPAELLKEPKVDPNHRPEARNLCICCDCNGHEEVEGVCRICKRTTEEIKADA
jgi:hypothetical protein